MKFPKFRNVDHDITESLVSFAGVLFGIYLCSMATLHSVNIDHSFTYNISVIHEEVHP